jgi:hypothetical protein
MTDDSQTAASGPAPMRAADILSQRLPSVPKVDPNAPKTPGAAQTGVPAAAKSSPTPGKVNKPIAAGTEQKAGINSGEGKSTASGTAAAASTLNKTGAEQKKPPSAGQSTATLAGATGAAATTPPKPKPTPKKAATPAAAPDSTTQEPSATPTATPRATSTPAANQSANQEKPPR